MHKELASDPLIVDFGFDWLRLTWPKSSEELPVVGTAVLDRLEELHSIGYQTTEKKLLQFIGIGTDKLQWVESSTHWMLNASGAEANETAKRIIRTGATGHATRLDTQITVDYHERDLQLPTRLRDGLSKSTVGTQKVNRQNNALFTSCDGDTGITIGHRSSATYGRFYNALDGGHSEYPNSVWRAECEWKSERADELWSAARVAACPDTLAAARTAGQFLSWGINQPWMHQALPLKAPPIPDRRSSDKTINWLNNQVKAACERLVKEGRTDEVRRFSHDVFNIANLVSGATGQLESGKLIEQARRRSL